VTGSETSRLPLSLSPPLLVSKRVGAAQARAIDVLTNLYGPILNQDFRAPKYALRLRADRRTQLYRNFSKFSPFF